MRLSSTERELLIGAILDIIDASRAFEDTAVIDRMKNQAEAEVIDTRTKNLKRVEFQQFIEATRDRCEAAVKKLLRSICHCEEAEVLAGEVCSWGTALAHGNPEIRMKVEQAVERCEKMRSIIDDLGGIVA